MEGIPAMKSKKAKVGSWKNWVKTLEAAVSLVVLDNGGTESTVERHQGRSGGRHTGFCTVEDMTSETVLGEWNREQNCKL
jgi:beta-galactosidase GanA